MPEELTISEAVEYANLGTVNLPAGSVKSALRGARLATRG